MNQQCNLVVILCAHPKYCLLLQVNFVGKLLGPGGNSLKRLQQETQTKMAIQGRGSMRDKSKVGQCSCFCIYHSLRSISLGMTHVVPIAMFILSGYYFIGRGASTKWRSQVCTSTRKSAVKDRGICSSRRGIQQSSKRLESRPPVYEPCKLTCVFRLASHVLFLLVCCRCTSIAPRNALKKLKFLAFP